MKFKTQLLLLTVVGVLLIGYLQLVYYNKITQVAGRRVSTFTDTSMAQVENSLNIMFDRASNTASYFAVSSLTRSYLQESDHYESYLLYNYINDSVKSAINSEPMIQNMFFFDKQGNRVYSYQSINIQTYYDLMGISAQAIFDSGRSFFYFDEEHHNLLCISPIYLDNPIIPVENRRIGSLIITMNLEGISQTIAQLGNPEEVEFYLLDQNDAIVASNTGDAAIDWERPGFSYKTLVMEDTGFRIAACTNEATVLADYNFFGSYSLIVGAVFVLVFIVTAVIYNLKIVKPVNSLMEEVAGIGEQGRVKKRITKRYDTELSSLAQNINGMLESIEGMSHKIFETQQQMYEVELARKETELSALMSQINPHFLFNTIQTIGAIALLNNVPVVPKVCRYMSDIFRYSIKDGNYVAVEDEVEMIEKYLHIIEVRFGGRLQWNIRLADRARKKKIMKMLFQPLVENAVNHGIGRKEGDCRIAVSVYIDGDELVFEVSDDGTGIDDATYRSLTQMLNDMETLNAEMHRRKRIGIANIRYRSLLVYGEKTSMDIASGPQGTTVTLRLPGSEDMDSI